MFSIHVPLWFGLLKIKPSRRLRYEERYHQIPMWRIGKLCFVWQGYARPGPRSDAN